MKWLNWFYRNDKILFQIGFWIYNIEATLYFKPFFWQIQKYKAEGIIILRFGPFLFDLEW